MLHFFHIHDHIIHQSRFTSCPDTVSFISLVFKRLRSVVLKILNTASRIKMFVGRRWINICTDISKGITFNWYWFGISVPLTCCASPKVSPPSSFPIRRPIPHRRRSLSSNRLPVLWSRPCDGRTARPPRSRSAGQTLAPWARVQENTKWDRCVFRLLQRLEIHFTNRSPGHPTP